MNFNKTINIEKLKQEIRNSNISISLDNVLSSGTSCEITFKTNLTEVDIQILSSLVENHIAIPLPNNDIQTVSIFNTDKSISVQSNPFAAKILSDGRKIYKRYTGIQSNVNVGFNTIIYTIPYPLVKIVGMDVLYAEKLDTLDLSILDSTTGKYTSIPNSLLNQFGFSINISEGYFRQESNFDADLYKDMQIKMVYKSASTKTVGFTFNFSEVK